MQINEDKIEDKNEDKSSNDAEIIALITEFNTYTIPQLANKMKIKVSRMRSIITRLERENGLRHVGSRKSGHWVFLPPSAPNP